MLVWDSRHLNQFIIEIREDVMPVDVTMENFEREVIESVIPVLAYFHLPS